MIVVGAKVCRGYAHTTLLTVGGMYVGIGVFPVIGLPIPADRQELRVRKKREPTHAFSYTELSWMAIHGMG